MKKLFILIALVSSITALYAQAPFTLNYQGVARNSVGNAIANQIINLRLSIRDLTATGAVTYAETRSVTTNTFGLFNVVIGSAGATSVTGTVAGVNWAVGAKFLQVEMDPTGGSSFITMGISQLNSVPFAINAATATPSGPAGGVLAGTYPNPTITAGGVTQSMLAPGIVALPIGPAGGSLTGNYPNPTIANGAVTLSMLAPGVLPTSLPPNGPAGGDLAGTYPNPTLLLPNAKTVADNGALLSLTNSGTAAGSSAISGTTNSTAGNAVALRGTVSNTLPGAFSTAVRGINNGTGGLGIGVWGSQAGSGWGVYGTTPNGIGVYGDANATGTGVYGRTVTGTGVIGTSSAGGIGGEFSSTAGIALSTTGIVRLLGISEGAGKVLTSDASGFATWQPVGAASGSVTGSGILNYIPKWTPSGTALGNSLLFDDGNSIGLGTITPTHKLDVTHGGNTGIGINSTAGFSVLDINAFSGDAALRFVNNGVNQWNLRNRPADNYLELFELGGGGSRLVVQDGTGNVGIGETTNPLYKLDILHGGSTGTRIKSSSSFSVLDIDGASGDAALRFVNNGVNQWNLRNRPADNYLELFELGGGGSRLVVQDGTGNVGIGETTNPQYKLDILHGGGTGTRIKSSASFSVLDIDGASGDAALRFLRAGTNQWNTRNNPGTDDYQIFELGGGGERMRIENTTGKVVVNGDFTAVGVKAFTMDHPLDPTNKILMHAAVESNEVINSYSGNVATDATGKVTVMLPEYFEAINTDFRYQLTVVGGTFAQAIISKEISNNVFEIATSQPNVKVSWEVKGVRNDARMKKYPFVAVTTKTAAQVGKYIDPNAYNLPESKRVSYTAANESSINDLKPQPTQKQTVQENAVSSVANMPSTATAKPAPKEPANSSIAPTATQATHKTTTTTKPTQKSSIDN